MSKVDIQKVHPEESPAISFSEEIKDIFDRIRTKAFEVFERRGSTPGKEIDDWVQAERELFWIPQSALSETDTEFRIEAGVPGLDVRDIQVTAEPDAILIRGHRENHSEKETENVRFSEFDEKTLYRRIELAAPIDLDRINAKLDKGLLTIIAPKKTVAVQETKVDPKKKEAAA